MIDDEGNYRDSYPPIEEGQLSSGAMDALMGMKEMLERDPEGVPEDSGWYYYAQRFAEGMGRAYVGYSEAMDVMGDAAEGMRFRLFSMTDDRDIPVFYTDAAAVNARISPEKKALAIDLLNMITGREVMTAASKDPDHPRYLLWTRYSVYDELASGDPIFGRLKEIVSVPEVYVFRIKPDGYTYLKEAKKNVGFLPDLLVR